MARSEHTEAQHYAAGSGDAGPAGPSSRGVAFCDGCDEASTGSSPPSPTEQEFDRLYEAFVALDERTLTLQTDAGSIRRIPLSYAVSHLDHGYAFTGHAAQGATVERAFVLAGDQGALHEWGYVACSRARTETRLYLSTSTPDLDAH